MPSSPWHFRQNYMEQSRVVLVVDDSRSDQKRIADCLKDSGFEIRYAASGKEALQAIADNEPEVVLTEMILPDCDGLEFVDQIRRASSHVAVVLITAAGSEQLAIDALRSGAASYIPKHELESHLHETVAAVFRTAEAVQTSEACKYLRVNESYYVLGYETQGASCVIQHLEDELTKTSFCNEAERIRIGTALTEAFANAIDHGNLELDSKLRESADDSYFVLGKERRQQDPFKSRRVHITARLTPTEATYVIRDEGRGFDTKNYPDPTDPENIVKLSGRGLLLIHSFMDKVTFNETGNEITMVKRRP